MSQPSPKRPELEHEETFIAIRWLIACLRVIEDLITAISGYGIVFALAVGVVDLFTNGQLTTSWPWVDWLYAFALAAGIGGQLIAVSSRASRAFHQGNWAVGVGFTILALLLGVVEYEAAVVYGYHKVFNQPVAVSLAQLGISQGGFIQLRSVTSVALALLSGFLRFQPKVKKSIEEVEAEEEYKRRKHAAQSKTRQAQFAEIRGMVKQSLGQKAGAESPPNDEPLSPSEADNGGAIGDESTVDDGTLNPEWLLKYHPNRWRWQELQAWIRSELHREVSEEEARNLIKTTAKHETARRVGSPTIAPIGLAKNRARAYLKVKKVVGFDSQKAVNS